MLISITSNLVHSRLLFAFMKRLMTGGEALFINIFRSIAYCYLLSLLAIVICYYCWFISAMKKVLFLPAFSLPLSHLFMGIYDSFVEYFKRCLSHALDSQTSFGAAFKRTNAQHQSCIENEGFFLMKLSNWLLKIYISCRFRLLDNCRDSLNEALKRHFGELENQLFAAVIFARHFTAPTKSLYQCNEKWEKR